jgi:hypothetical protein
MKVDLIDSGGKSVSPFTTGDGKGELFSYTNTITKKSDPFIRFDVRPMMMAHLSTLSYGVFSDRQIKREDGSVVSIESMMDYKGNPEQ